MTVSDIIIAQKRRASLTNKATLVPGETLIHQFMGIVQYDETCQELERRRGVHDTLFVSDGGDIIEVTLSLCERKVAGGDFVRLVPVLPAAVAIAA